jgi:hypothetical protein
MLRNVTQAKFRQSLDAVAEIRKELAGKFLRPTSAQLTPTRKPSRDEAARAAAVA